MTCFVYRGKFASTVSTLAVAAALVAGPVALAHAADTATSPAPAVTTTAPAKTVQMGTADTAPQTATAPVIAPATTDVPRSPDAPKPADAAKTGTHKADAHKAGKQKDVQAPTAKADAHAAAPAAKKTTVQQ